MELEQQVCSLELAKRLKELGVKQDSVFFYIVDSDDGYIGVRPINPTKNDGDSRKHFSAFTVAELGELLPTGIQTYRTSRIPGYSCRVFGPGKPKVWAALGHRQRDTNEANARAKMLIYLLENKLIQ